MSRVGESTMQPVYAGVSHAHDLVFAIQACKTALINALGSHSDYLATSSQAHHYHVADICSEVRKEVKQAARSRDSRHACENLQTDLEGRDSIKLRLVLSILMLPGSCLGVDHAVSHHGSMRHDIGHCTLPSTSTCYHSQAHATIHKHMLPCTSTCYHAQAHAVTSLHQYLHPIRDGCLHH